MEKFLLNLPKLFCNPKFNSQPALPIVILTLGLTLVSGSVATHAQGGDVLPLPDPGQASSAPAATSTAPSVVSKTETAAEEEIIVISSLVPSYIDRNVTMVPLRPLADFLNIKVRIHDGIINLSQQDAQSKQLIVVTARLNGRVAQISNGSTMRSVNLALPMESRIGNVFIPLRFLASTFRAQASFRVPDNAVVLRIGNKIGVLTPKSPPEFTAKSASTLTIVNHIGRPMSLRLNGPQKIALELGRGQKITRRIAPGVYYYQAVCSGMRPRSGARRLIASRRVNWIWGKR